MAWINDSYVQPQQWNHEPHVHIIQQPALQQPTTILQQIPSTMWSSAPPVCRRHVKEDLVELMMIQNAQMQQVIMNNMTMSALSSFGYFEGPPAQEPVRCPVIVEDEDQVVYHHHYQPVALPPYPAWVPPLQPQPGPLHQESVERRDLWPGPCRDRRAVPPPPPPSATRTVGAEVCPAAGYYSAIEATL